MAAPALTLPEQTRRRVARRLMPFLLLLYFFAFIDRTNIGIAKLGMQREFGFTDEVIGFGASIFFLGYFLFEIPGTLIVERWSARKWIARIMISWGIVSAAMMFTRGATSFYALRFLLGVAEAGFFPGMILYLTYWFPERERARAVALFMTANALAGVVGGPVSGALLSVHGAGGLAGWQWLFLLEGLPSVLVGILVFVALDDRISKAKWLTDEEKELLQRHVSAEEATKHDMPIRQVLTSGRVLMLSHTYFSFVMGLYGVSFWLPTIIKATGVTDAFAIGLLSAIPFAAAVVAMVLVARSADRMRERRWHIALPAFAGAVGLVLSVVYTHNTVLAMASLTLATMGILTTLPLFWSLPTAILAGTGAAAGIAMINSIGNLAGFLSPYAVGWLKQATAANDSGMYMLAAFLVLGGLLAISVPARMVNR